MSANGTRIAHLSDVHMLDARPSRTRSGWSMNHRFLSFGRALDARARRRKLVNALSEARHAGADHLVLSGDLTEIGSPHEFESLAEVLHESAIAPERITLVPGNHDLYSSANGWRDALAGPLAAFAPTSARAAGLVVECAGVHLLPLDVAFHQPVTRSAGLMADPTFDILERRVADDGLARRPLVVVQHHPPFVRQTRAWHWVDGLIGAARLMILLERFRHVFVLHGHLHAVVNRALACGVTRVLGATAVVDDGDAPRIRLYDVSDGDIQAAGLVADPICGPGSARDIASPRWGHGRCRGQQSHSWARPPSGWPATGLR
ncbi:MAG: metallophosphoesterase [Myxococcota bacterium]|nr:metallophosphoesterase [Myxococcota bacterium]